MRPLASGGVARWRSRTRIPVVIASAALVGEPLQAGRGHLAYPTGRDDQAPSEAVAARALSEKDVHVVRPVRTKFLEDAGSADSKRYLRDRGRSAKRWRAV